MTYGLQIFASNGVTKTFDSTIAAGGCVVDMVALIPTGTVYNTGYQSGTQIKAYTDFVGRVAYVILISGYAVNTPPNVDNTTYAYPVVTFYPFNAINYSTAYPPEVYMVILL